MATTSHISLGELQRRVKESLIERFPLPLWITAEVADLKVNYSGHCYLELIEKGAHDSVPKAQARAVIWRSNYPAIAAYFEQQTGQRLGAGLRILVSVLVNYHELYGFSLQIVAIDPAYTLGDMEQQRLQTIARLQEEGVWEMNRMVQMPHLVQRIAVVSSAQAAGYQDFMKELGKAPYAFRTTLFEAAMQGTTAEESIVAALTVVAERQEQFDAVVIVRGGGSTSDLNCFNSYRLCAHIAQFPLPILTGIGHDKDQSVADMVAHTALKTPTAVAAWLAERSATLDAWLEGAAQQLRENTVQRLRREELRLEQLRNTLGHNSRERIHHHTLQLEQFALLLPERCRERLQREWLRLQRAEELTESRSPQRILQLGFAILRTEGKLIRKVEQLHQADALTVELAEGRTTLHLQPRNESESKKPL